MSRLPVASALLLLTVAGCAQEEVMRPTVVPAGPTQAQTPQASGAVRATSTPSTAPYQVGMATWYGKAFAGAKTSSGERFDPGAMTAAHRKLPFNTWVEVRRPDTGGAVRVRITDRGPWGNASRIIDLSQAAAERLGIVAAGVARVELRVVPGP